MQSVLSDPARRFAVLMMAKRSSSSWRNTVLQAGSCTNRASLRRSLSEFPFRFQMHHPIHQGSSSSPQIFRSCQAGVRHEAAVQRHCFQSSGANSRGNQRPTLGILPPTTWKRIWQRSRIDFALGLSNASKQLSSDTEKKDRAVLRSPSSTEDRVEARASST